MCSATLTTATTVHHPVVTLKVLVLSPPPAPRRLGGYRRGLAHPTPGTGFESGDGVGRHTSVMCVQI